MMCYTRVIFNTVENSKMPHLAPFLRVIHTQKWPPCEQRVCDRDTPHRRVATPAVRPLFAIGVALMPLRAYRQPPTQQSLHRQCRRQRALALKQTAFYVDSPRKSGQRSTR